MEAIPNQQPYPNMKLEPDDNDELVISLDDDELVISLDELVISLNDELVISLDDELVVLGAFNAQ